MTEPETDNFWSQVDKSGDCWLWTGDTLGGVGIFHAASSGREGFHYSFWWAYHLITGKEPYALKRTCRNRLCVNPDHYQPWKGCKLRGPGLDVVE
jgi:hypothetical protein